MSYNKLIISGLYNLSYIISDSAFKYPERVGLTLGNTVLNHTISFLYIAAPFDDAELVGQIIQAIPDQIKGSDHYYHYNFISYNL